MGNLLTDLFTGATMTWIGTNLCGADDQIGSEYRRYLDAGAASTSAEVTTHRLEKMRQSPRRSFGPDFLSVFESGKPIIAPPPGEPTSNVAASWADNVESMWQMTWTMVSDSGSVGVRPDRVRLISLSPPPDASEADVAEWNAFYTEVHVPEAMQRRRWTRATRWVLDHAELHPSPGCPTYFVLYEAVGFTDATPEEVDSWGPWSEGPPIWKRHVGAWTLDYRSVRTGARG
jgi:hypothetical protein